MRPAPHFAVLGIDHSCDRPDLLDALVTATGQLEEVIAALGKSLDEAMVLSTCNRTEFYGVGADRQGVVDALHGLTLDHFGIDTRPPESGAYLKSDLDAAKHLFRVTAGMMSMVPGDAQISGQVRRAFSASVDAGKAGKVLHLAYQHAHLASRAVRSTNSAGHRDLSVAERAVQHINDTSPVPRLKVALIGAGEMASYALLELHALRATDITIFNRSIGNARRLTSRFGLIARPLRELSGALNEFDVVFACVSATDYVLRREDIGPELAAAGSRRLTVVDLGHPPSIDPAVRDIGVHLLDLHQLGRIWQQDKSANFNGQASEPHESLIDQAVAAFRSDYEKLDRVADIRLLTGKAESIRRAEVARTIRRLEAEGRDGATLTDALDALTRSITRRLLHDPISFLRNTTDSDSLEPARQALGLDQISRRR